MDAELKSARSALNNAFTITIDRDVDLPMGSVICSAARIGNGFLVKDCDFGFNRSRGILIKASHGEVSGNWIDGSRMSAILVSPEYWWLEAGSSSDVRITKNCIHACGGIPICIEAAGGNGDIAPPGAHRDITITGNQITDCAMPGILVTSTAGLRLENNRLDLRANSKTVPELMRRAGLKAVQPVVEIQCEPRDTGGLRSAKNPPDMSERLQKLQSLYNQGLITKDEFEKKKSEMLDSL
jgi:parallel beta-helix repeat protein